MELIGFLKGKGNTGSKVDIKSIPNLQAWYEVYDSSSITLSGNTLVSLIDKSGNGRHMTTTSTNMPTYSATGGPNGLACLNIDATHNTQINGVNIAAGTIVYALVKMASTVQSSGTYTIIGYTAGTYQNGLVQTNLQNGQIPIGQFAGLPSDNPFLNTFNTNWQVLQFNALGNSIPGQGVSIFTTTNNEPTGYGYHYGSPIGITDLSIGHAANSNTFSISALIVVNSTISQHDDQMIRSYLINLAGITPNRQLHCYGDSTTAGSGATTYAQRWTWLVATSKNMSLTNWGFGGTILFPNNGSTGVASFNYADLAANEFNHTFFYDGQNIIFDYGINDASQGGVNATWAATYQGYIQAYINKGVPLSKIVICIPPSTSARQALMAPANAFITTIASNLGIKLCDLNTAFAQNPALFFDTLHPNDTGYALWASTISPLIT